MVAGCHVDNERPVTLSQAVRGDCGRLTGEHAYFGISFKVAAEGIGTRSNGGYYADTLMALSEPSLLCGQCPDAGYRLLWIPSLGGEIVTIRVERSGSRVTLQSAAKGDTVRRRPSRVLTQAEWQRLESAMNDLVLWLLPTIHLEGPGNPGPMLDASTWVLEGRSDRMYHVIVRGTGVVDSAFNRVATNIVFARGSCGIQGTHYSTTMSFETEKQKRSIQRWARLAIQLNGAAESGRFDHVTTAVITRELEQSRVRLPERRACRHGVGDQQGRRRRSSSARERMEAVGRRLRSGAVSRQPEWARTARGVRASYDRRPPRGYSKLTARRAAVNVFAGPLKAKSSMG